MIQFWDVYNDCQNIGFIKGHKNAILDLKWSLDSSSLYTASADKTAVVWDTTNFAKIRTFRGHENNLNSVDVLGDRIVTGSDDCTLKVWDQRTQKYTLSFKLGYQITSVA